MDSCILFLIVLGAVGVAAVFAITAHRAVARMKFAERVSGGDFLLAFSGLLAKVAMADGTVSASEVETVERMFADMGLSRAERAMCVGNFMLAQRELRGAKEYTLAIAESMNRMACAFLFGILWKIVMADGRISSEESALLTEIGVAFGLGENATADLRLHGLPAYDTHALKVAGVPSGLVKFARCE